MVTGILGMTLVAAACTGTADESPESDAPGLNGGSVVAPPPERDTAEAMTLNPSNPQPGAVFSARFGEDSYRGGYFYLFQWDGTAWGPPLYQLESDAIGRRPSAVRIVDGVGSDDYDVAGPGPDGLVMPDDLAAGHWRLCTADAVDLACVQIRVG